MYCISSYSFRRNYSFLNLEIVANSNSCHNISIFYLINWILASETIWGNTVYEIKFPRWLFEGKPNQDKTKTYSQILAFWFWFRLWFFLFFFCNTLINKTLSKLKIRKFSKEMVVFNSPKKNPLISVIKIKKGILFF